MRVYLFLEKVTQLMFDVSAPASCKGGFPFLCLLCFLQASKGLNRYRMINSLSVAQAVSWRL